MTIPELLNTYQPPSSPLVSLSTSFSLTTYLHWGCHSLTCWKRLGAVRYLVIYIKKSFSLCWHNQIIWKCWKVENIWARLQCFYNEASSIERYPITEWFSKCEETWFWQLCKSLRWINYWPSAEVGIERSFYSKAPFAREPWKNI